MVLVCLVTITLRGGQNFGSNWFDNVQVTSSSVTEPVIWTYDNTKYWPTQGHIDFLAYAPFDNSKTLSGTKIDFTVSPTVTEQKDLLWANAANKTMADNPVKFTFNHALAKIGYSLKQKEAYSNTTIKVTSIKLVGSDNTGVFYAKGTVDLSKANKDESLWTPDDKVTKLSFDWFTGGKELTNDAASNDANNNLFVIPQDFSAAATDKLFVVVEYTVQTAGTAVLYNKVTKPITTKFDQGKAYMINLTIGLTPIEFDVDVVTDWDTTGGDININSWN